MVRQIVAARNGSPKLTVVGIGPALLNTLPWIAEQGHADVFAVSQLPFSELDSAVVVSVVASGTLFVVEEHAPHGGLAEPLAAALARQEEPMGIVMHCLRRGFLNYRNTYYHQGPSLDVAGSEIPEQ